MADMALILGGILLPKYSDFKEIVDPNETDNVTLGGTLYTDFINRRRSWVVSWKLLKAVDFATIRTLYNAQYTNGRFPTLQYDADSVYTAVKINISEKNIKYNGTLIEDFSIVLKEQYAVS